MVFQPVWARVRIGAAMKFAEINWNRLPMKGWGGTVTAIGLLVLIAVGVPEVPRILWPAIVVGVLYGLIRYWRWNR